MKTILQLILLFGVSIMAFAVATTSASQNQSQTDNPLNFANMTLQVSIPQKQYINLEPVPILVRLSNDNKQAVIGHKAIKFSDNRIAVYVGQVGNERTKVEQVSNYRALVDVVPFLIQPGETYEEQELLSINLEQVFPHAGDYELQLTLTDSEFENEVKSNVVSVSIVNPRGKDAEALSFLQHIKEGGFFFSGNGIYSDAAFLQKMKDFVALYSDSTYGDYATFVLGEYYFTKKDFKKALTHLSKLKAKPNFVRAAKVRDYYDKAVDKTKLNQAP